MVLAGCGGGSHPRATTTVVPAPQPGPPPAFAIGIDERNPHLYAPGPQPGPFARFRDALVALRPYYVRVQVNWSVVQPSVGAPPDWTVPNGGCARAIPPCAPFAGIRDALRGVRALGAVPVLLIYGTPDWAAEPAAGCDQQDPTPFTRMPKLDAYRTLVRSLRTLVQAEHVATPYWSAWNEPNLPIFLNPQRSGCDIHTRSVAAAGYAQLVRALAAQVGLGRVVVGEASGITPHTHATGAAELAGDLPDDLICGAAAWTQHAYVTSPIARGARSVAVPPDDTRGIVAGVEGALAAHRCGHRVPVWITESGAGNRSGACAAMAAQLRAWKADPQIAAVFQYSFRDDPLFPVGLADAKLTRLYPAYAAWRTRGETSCH